MFSLVRDVTRGKRFVFDDVPNLCQPSDVGDLMLVI